MSPGRIAEWALTRTAAGEWAGEVFLRGRLHSFAAAEAGARTDAAYGPERYRIAGGGDFESNARLFNRRFMRINSDASVLNENYLPIVEPRIRDYLHVLGVMQADCQKRGVRLVFVYFPAYPQIYDEGASLRIRDILAEACESMGIDFVDLLPAFRAAPREKVYHLAPLDFHTNPDGNRLMAQAVAEFLVSRSLLEAR